MTYDFSDKIRNGIKFLDQDKPGWEHEIDLDKLELSDCVSCVLGQTFGNYYNVLDRIVNCGWPQQNEWAAERGFYTHGSEWRELTDQWVTAIEKHRVRETVED